IIDVIDVVADSPGHVIGAGTAIQHVITGPAVEVIDILAPEKDVVSAVAPELIASCAAIQEVRAIAAMKNIGTGSADQNVTGRATGDRVVAAPAVDVAAKRRIAVDGIVALV